uniref:hypothetical protein n=1 Tax=unclassified Variovorax TaxID=663243 RepID=UPI000D33196F
MTSKGTDKWASGKHTTGFNTASRGTTPAPRVSSAPTAAAPKVLSPSPAGTQGPAMAGAYRKTVAGQAHAEQTARHNAAVGKPATPTVTAAPTAPTAPKSAQPAFHAASTPRPMSAAPSTGKSR